MLVELIRVGTRDGVRLDGIFREPAHGDRRLPIDAALVVHGAGGNFYSSPLFDAISDALVGQGVSVLRCNTRGHDAVSTAATSEGGRRQGAAYENMDECRHDLIAWLEWLNQRGFWNVALIGHSNGAVKAIYTMAQETAPWVTALVAISPPRLSYSWFLESEGRAEFQACFEIATREIQAGRPDKLLEVGFPLPLIITAGNYVDKYGPAERYNFLRFLDRLTVPTLLTFGSIEVSENPAFASLPALVVSESAAKREVEVIDGANHFYVGKFHPLMDKINAWLTKLPKPDA
jgi:alpha/beta superfamily hydrolase